MNDDVLLH